MKNIVVFGATSKIAYELEKRILTDGASRLFLCSHNSDRLESLIKDLSVRVGNTNRIFGRSCDFSVEAIESILRDAKQLLGTIDGVIVAQGSLTEQKKGLMGGSALEDCIDINVRSVAACMLQSAKVLDDEQGGVLMVLSSVAADRAKRSNFIYGAAKSYQSYIANGIRLEYGGRVRVLDVHLGSVSTPMTEHLHQGFLFANPYKVAKRLHQLWINESKEGSFYVPGYWSLIMFIIKRLPVSILRRLSI